MDFEIPLGEAISRIEVRSQEVREQAVLLESAPSSFTTAHYYDTSNVPVTPFVEERHAAFHPLYLFFDFIGGRLHGKGHALEMLPFES